MKQTSAISSTRWWKQHNAKFTSYNVDKETGKYVQTFKLIPYPAGSLPKIDISGEIIRSGNKFFMRFEVNGEIDRILLPAKSSTPSRTDDLWQATCFEFFIATPNQPEYWEFNMSPSGDWNVYKMDAYRRVGFREETAFTQLPFVLRETDNRLSLDISVDLSPILQPQQTVQVGITAIIQSTDGNESYWALAHPGTQADFHLRNSFILSV